MAERRLRYLACGVAVAGLLVAACGNDDAIPIDPSNGPSPTDESIFVDPDEPRGSTPDVSHPIEPTDQMQEVARQQCLDDPSKTEGYVRAVDPATGDVLVEVTVDCAEVRGE